jgi:hypothetical protein
MNKKRLMQMKSEELDAAKAIVAKGETENRLLSA